MSSGSSSPGKRVSGREQLAGARGRLHTAQNCMLYDTVQESRGTARCIGRRNGEGAWRTCVVFFAVDEVFRSRVEVGYRADDNSHKGLIYVLDEFRTPYVFAARESGVISYERAERPTGLQWGGL